MSIYERYNKTCMNYDKTRIPIGLEIIHDFLLRSGRPLSQLRLLDAGCGTGSYSGELVKYVKQIAAIDMSSGMIDAARRKLAPYGVMGRLTFYQANIKSMPFQSQTFDAVVINQVLHHTENTQNDDYPNHFRILLEIHRILRSKGSLIINTCSQDQLMHGFWYYRLIPEAAKRFRIKFIPLERLTRMLGDCGFSVHDRFVPRDYVFQGNSYFDPLGPLRKEWRDGDSIFALVSNEELESARKKILEMRDRVALSHFLKVHDKPRQLLGQATFILASRDSPIT